MELEILERRQRFKLKEKEKGGFHLDNEDVVTSIEECRRSLIGKLYGDKWANFTGKEYASYTLDRHWSCAGSRDGNQFVSIYFC